MIQYKGEETMPLLKIDLFDIKEADELKLLLDNLHEAVVEAFGVPLGDRYQIVTQHKENEMILEDTGLGFKRTKNAIVISVVSRKRTKESKLKFYQLVAEKLEKRNKIDPKDILISIVENKDADWSFGYGKAQFITGELS